MRRFLKIGEFLLRQLALAIATQRQRLVVNAKPRDQAQPVFERANGDAQCHRARLPGVHAVAVIRVQAAAAAELNWRAGCGGLRHARPGDDPSRARRHSLELSSCVAQLVAACRRRDGWRAQSETMARSLRVKRSTYDLPIVRLRR